MKYKIMYNNNIINNATLSLLTTQHENLGTSTDTKYLRAEMYLI